jgi:hypothetical protein
MEEEGADREGARLELLAAIKAHSQHLTAEEENGAGSGPSGEGWSDEEWRGAFQQLVGVTRTEC